MRATRWPVVMPDVAKKARDWSAAADAIDTGGALVSMYHQLGLFCHPIQGRADAGDGQVHLACARLRTQRRRYKHRQALLASPDDAVAGLPRRLAK